MSSTTTTIISRNGQCFLDPEDVGSAIQYRINVQETVYDDKEHKPYVSLNASISLSDCNRWITWDLETDTSEEKLDNAIRILTAAKTALRAVRKAYEKRGGK